MKSTLPALRTGKWCNELAALLKQLTRSAVKQLQRQGAEPPPHVAALTPEVVDRFAAAMMRLAGRAQFSKDGGEHPTQPG